jgi:hypothetical protein
MANRNFNRLQALDKEVKHLYGTFDVGASGARTFDTAAISRSAGIKSITKESGAGQYTIVLGVPSGDIDRYSALLFFEAILLEAGAPAAEGSSLCQLVSEDVSGTTGSLVVNFVRSDTGAYANTPDGSKVLFHIVVKNSNLSAVGAGTIGAL